jgi:hypothetical protein
MATNNTHAETSWGDMALDEDRKTPQIENAGWAKPKGPNKKRKTEHKTADPATAEVAKVLKFTPPKNRFIALSDDSE